MIDTDFQDPGLLRDNDLTLVVKELVPHDQVKNFVPGYVFSMHLDSVAEPVGAISLRLGDNYTLIMHAGQIGYGVDEAHRGQRLASRSVRLLKPLAKSHGFEELWITCDPDNLASRRTCELAGAELVEIVDLPSGSDMYDRGDRFKCRYRIDLCAN